MAARQALRVGTAGWNLPRSVRARFSSAGSVLQQYASRLNAVEINSSFYRLHLPQTYARWAADTPSAFQFSVKLPKRVTHVLKLRDVAEELQTFLAGPRELGSKFRVLLIQLPPALEFEPEIARAFFHELRTRTDVAIVCEPRHASWFTSAAEELLTHSGVSRAAADPAPVPAAADPGGNPRLRYFRLHGSPKMYYSNYSDEYLDALRTRLERERSAAEVWCIFDNTAEERAAPNALQLIEPHHFAVGSSASLP